MKKFLIGFSAVLATGAFAQFQPFEKNFKCMSKNDKSSIAFVYDKTKSLDLGWQGEIQIEIETGRNSSLAQLVERAGLAEDGAKKTIRMAGLAGQVGNWIQQTPEDPFVAWSKLGFVQYHLEGRTANSFISDISISRAKTTGFVDSSKPTNEEFYLVEVLNDYVHTYLRFELSECVLAR